MTAAKFNLSERKIQTLCKEGKIHGVTRPNRAYHIPDETAIIITNENAQAFLWQLLKFKNNANIILQSHFADNETKLRAWHRYMIEQGLVGECEYSSNLKTLLEGMQITDAGFELLPGYKSSLRLLLEPRVNIDINIGCMNM